MRRLSCSQIGAFDWCPKGWYLKYIKKLWPEEKPQPLAFGIAFHDGMERLILDMMQEGTITDVMIDNATSKAEWEYSFGKNKGPDPDEWNPICVILIKAMAEKLRSMDFEPILAEKFFSLPGFCGKIDCVANVEGLITIVDWKTAGSGKKFTRKKVDKDPQLTAYSWLYPKEHDQMAFGVARKDTHKASWHPTTRTELEIADYRLYVNRIRRLMETQRTFVGVHVHNKCKWCDLYPTHCIGADDF